MIFLQRFLLFVMCFLLGQNVLAQSRTVPTSLYKREVMFRIGIGDANSQIGVYIPGDQSEDPAPNGPAGIQIGLDGKIYIADRVNQCVKIFDEQGIFQGHSAGKLINLSGIALDHAGNFYVLSGAAANTLTKFDSNGKRLWSLQGNQIAAYTNSHMSFHRIYPALGDTVALAMDGTPATLVFLDRNGKFLRLVKGDLCNEMGQIFSFSRIPGKKWARQVSVWSLNGHQLHSYILRPGEEALLQLKATETGLGITVIDPDGYIHITAPVSRPQRTTIGPNLTLAGDTLIMSYDPAGKANSVLRIPDYPIGTANNFDIDANGNVYALEYTSTQVIVVRYKLQNSRIAAPSVNIKTPSSFTNALQGYMQGEVLFNLGVGDKEEQVGVRPPRMGSRTRAPQALAISADGKIYLADPVNRKVKVFNKKGQFLLQTSGYIDSIQRIAVDKAGNIYVVHLESSLTKFSPDGQELWSINAQDVFPRQKNEGFYPARGFGRIFPAPDGNVAVALKDQPGTLALFDQDGKFLRLLKDDALTTTGQLVAAAPLPDQPQVTEVKISTLGQEKPTRSVTLHPDHKTPEIYTGLITGEAGWMMVDPSGRLYTVTDVQRPKPLVIALGLNVTADFAITAYDDKGEPSGYVQFPSSPAGFDLSNLAFDAQGNLYQLKVFDTRVDVVRYRRREHQITAK